MKRAKKSGASQGASSTDLLLATMRRLKMTVDLPAYLELAYPGRNLQLEPLTGEELAELPPEFLDDLKKRDN